MPILDKTSMCKFYQQRKCKKGKDCTFAHVEEELRGRPDLSGTKLCPFIQKGTQCVDPYCRFAHSKDEIRRLKVNHQTGRVYSKETPPSPTGSTAPNWMKDLDKLPVYNNPAPAMPYPGMTDAYNMNMNMYRAYAAAAMPAAMMPSPFMPTMPPIVPMSPMLSMPLVPPPPGMSLDFGHVLSDKSDKDDKPRKRNSKSGGGSPKHVEISDISLVKSIPNEKRGGSKVKSGMKKLVSITEEIYDDDMDYMTTGFSDGVDSAPSPTSSRSTTMSAYTPTASNGGRIEIGVAY